MRRSSLNFWFEAAEGASWQGCAQEYSDYSAMISFYAMLADDLVARIGRGARTLIDFGCGDGRLTRSFLKYLSNDVAMMQAIYLVDAASSMLELTNDLDSAYSGIRFERICDSDCMKALPSRAKRSIDVVACNSSLHLVQDVDAFLSRTADLLARGGKLIANIPDQDFRFEDARCSEFQQIADQVMPYHRTAQRPPARFSAAMLDRFVARHNLQVKSIDVLSVPVTWEDFVAFYSIPFMGARRMPGASQAQRVSALGSCARAFEGTIEYRWAVVSIGRGSS